jgi:hypothetical protein
MVTRKNLPWKAAIIRVLDNAGSAMHYTDIAQTIIEQNLRQKVGATPAATVAANITTDIKQSGDNSDFIRVKRGEYMLRKYYDTGAIPPDETADSTTIDETSEETGIIQAFGMYWRRNLIRWSNTPKILGQQSRGAEDVNFSDQRGVYLLHDGRETVYVGRSVERSLGVRLFEHTYDRLNGRWDRFSWFGILSVTENGGLVSGPMSTDQGVLVTTLEALLIEALEPPQNRKRGDDFRAVEYLQVEDPSLQRRRSAALLDELKDMLTE